MKQLIFYKVHHLWITFKQNGLLETEYSVDVKDVDSLPTRSIEQAGWSCKSHFTVVFQSSSHSHNKYLLHTHHGGEGCAGYLLGGTETYRIGP